MKQTVWTETYRINSFLVNLRGKAGLYAVLNLIQDVGWQHAFHLNIKLKNLAWVFTRQKLVMSEWPAWNETLTIRTWLRPPSPAGFLFRDYELFAEDRKVGECTSTFVTIDTQTRKMALQDWSAYAEYWHPEERLAHQPGKVIVESPVEKLAEFCVRNSDIDMNHHVNNTKYAQWILDALPIEKLRNGADLLEYEVNFLAETVPGDIVSVQKGGEPAELRFQGIRTGDGKQVFTARMKLSGAC